MPQQYRYIFEEAKKIGKIKCGHIIGKASDLGLFK
jgi:hypothetical protein